MRFVTILVFAAALVAQAEEKKHVEIDTPQGKVEWKTSDGGSISRVVRDVSSGELQVLQSDAHAAVAFLARYGPKDRGTEHPLELLDLAFAAWLLSEDPKKESADRVIHILGSAYGFYCIKHLGVRWAWTQDDHGLTIALVRENPTTVGYPFSSIQYRIEDRKTDFIYALYASLDHLIKDASEPKKPDKKSGLNTP